MCLVFKVVMDPAPALPGGIFSADFEDFISQCLHKERTTTAFILLLTKNCGPVAIGYRLIISYDVRFSNPIQRPQLGVLTIELSPFPVYNIYSLASMMNGILCFNL